MASRAVVQKFARINKAVVRGKVKHSRTGACTCKLTQKCQHGKAPKAAR